MKSGYNHDHEAHGKLKVTGTAEEGGSLKAALTNSPLAPPSDGSLGRYYLVDANTNATIVEVKNGDTISSSLIGSRNVTLVAEPVNASVQSVKMSFDGAPTRVESVAPYALFGNQGGDLWGGNLTLDGSNNGIFSFYSADGAGGTLLGSESLSFAVVDPVQPPPVVPVKPLVLKLVDAKTDQIIDHNLADGVAALDPSVLGNLSVAAYAANGQTINGAVSLKLTGEGINYARVENVAPYALFGNDGNNFDGKALAAGDYRIETTANGITQTIDFELASTGPATPPVVTPPVVTPPVTGDLEGTAGHDHLVGTTANNVMRTHADADTLAGRAGNDILWGGTGDDKAWGGSGNDQLFGEDGNDMLAGGFGSDVVNGGAGNDMIFSRSDAGEPEIANLDGNGVGNMTINNTKLYPNEPFLDANDVLIGGSGADTFRFEFLINGRDYLTQSLTKDLYNEYGLGDGQTVPWYRVHDYSNYLHDHYIESIGFDVILDFNKAEGDKIEFAGHTVHLGDNEHDINWNAGTIHYGSDAQGSYSEFSFIAAQGGGGHAGDYIGKVRVYGDKITRNDFTNGSFFQDSVNPRSPASPSISVDRDVHYGAYEKLGQGPHLWEDDGILPYSGTTGGHHLIEV